MRSLKNSQWIFLLLRDEDIETNDNSVNRNKDSLRPGTDDSPATSSVDNFTVTIRFPEYGVVIDRIIFPDRDNIDAVRMYVYKPDNDEPVPVNFDQVSETAYVSKLAQNIHRN